jgi:predicted nucleic acid-binding protein
VTACFFDSSGIVKRYVLETGSTWVNQLVDPAAGNPIHLVNLTGVEVVSAIVRRVRSGSVSAADAAVMLGGFRHDFANQYRIVDVTPPLITQAMTLAEAHALRGYDAVQLAVALHVQTRYARSGLSLTLVSADAELNAAATAEGLLVEDPNAHP